jgi:hypothetical protein
LVLMNSQDTCRISGIGRNFGICTRDVFDDVGGAEMRHFDLHSDRDGDRVRGPWGVPATVDLDVANVRDSHDLVRVARRLRFERSRGRVPSLSLPRADG